MEGRPRVGVRVPCQGRGADSLPQHEGGGGQASAGSPPRRRGRLGLAGRRWRRLRRWEGSWVVFRRGRVGSLLMLLLVRPLALATRHTRRGAGSYKGRRGRRSGRSHNTIARAGNSRALFEPGASRLGAGCCSARGLGSVLIGGCNWTRRRSSRVWLQGRAEGSLDKGRWSGSGLGQRARHSRRISGSRRTRDETVESALAVRRHAPFSHLKPLDKLCFDFVQGRV